MKQSPSRKRLSVAASVLAVAVLTIARVGASEGGSSSPPPTPNPLPSISSLSPAAATAGAAAQTLTINGTNFLSGSTVTYNGVSHAATHVASTQLTIPLSAPDQAIAGSYPVVVTNPSPGGGTSSAMLFSVLRSGLTVNIIDLPAGTAANVTVTGPNGFGGTLTSSQTIADVRGTFVVSAKGVVVGSNTYYATNPVQSVTIAPGSAAAVTVDYFDIVPSTTKVLDEAGMQSLKVSADRTTLTIAGSSKIAASLRVGDVLASAPTPAAPNGLLVKIGALSTAGGTVTATVRRAALEEAILQADFSFKQVLGPSNIHPVGAGKRPLTVPEARKAGIMAASDSLPDSCSGIADTFVLPFNQTIGAEGGISIGPRGVKSGYLVQIAGHMELCPELDIHVTWGSSGLNSLTASASFGEHAKVSVQGQVWGTDSIELEDDNSFVTGPVIVLVGGVPVVLQGEVAPFVGVSGSDEGAFYSSAEQDAKAQVGLAYANRHTTTIGPSATFALSAGPISNGATTAEFKGYAGLKLGVLIYERLFVYVAPDAYVRWSADAQADPWWTLSLGAEAGVGADVSIIEGPVKIGLSLESPDLDLFHMTIKQAPGPYSLSDVTPTLTAISPELEPAGSPSVSIALQGSNFLPDSVASFNGIKLTTTFADPNHLTAVVPAADLASAGVFPVTVSNPDTAGAVSNAANFTVTSSSAGGVTVAKLSFNPTSIAPGASATGTVTLSGPAPSGGALVWLSSNNTSVLTMPAHVTVPAGSTSATFTATASSSVSTSTQVTVTASYNSSSQSATVTVAPTSGVTVTVSPSTAQVLVNGTEQFTATVTGTSNTAVTWSVNGITGGNSTVGTITSGGLYTAPVTVPNPATVTVTATSQASSAATGSASVTIQSSTSVATGSMSIARAFHTSTLLGNGMVLVAGGAQGPLMPGSGATSSADLYNSSAATFNPTGSMSTPRTGHTATLLSNGKVLVTGGMDSSGNALATAEVYDPVAGTFTPTGGLAAARFWHRATLLSNGTILITGGIDNWGNTLASAEVYDPETGTFTATGGMTSPRYLQTATLLNDGKVLVAGGFAVYIGAMSSVELYDPVAGAFSATASMTTVRYGHTATMLNNGTVLIVGGWDENNNPQASAEVYDPVAGTFTATGSMTTARHEHRATLLGSGEVLITGGVSTSGVSVSSVELYDPVAGTFTTTNSMTTPRQWHAATLLSNGEVLITGGLDNSGNALASAELYLPPTQTPPGLVSIQVTPASPVISAGLTEQFTATGTFSGGSAQELQSVTWSSSNQSVATISNDASDHGTALGVAAGSTTITATAGSVSGSTTLTVTGAAPSGVVVSSLTFNPTSIAPGASTTGTVTLSGAAPTGGALVMLSSNNPSVLPVPRSVTVQAGSTTATFTATASTSAGNSTQVQVSASYNNSSANATVTVTPTSGASYTESLLHIFADGTDGAAPWAPLVQGTDGYYYGTTVAGGTPGLNTGAVFKVDSSGGFAPVYAFCGVIGCSKNPITPLIQASNGDFYGTTLSATTEDGSVYEMDPSGNMLGILSFSNTDYRGGQNPNGLIQATDGDLYGTTWSGGTPLIFRVDLALNFTPLHPFSGTFDEGWDPRSTLVQATDGYLYGTTLDAGNLSTCRGKLGLIGCGTVFKFDPVSKTLSTLWQFTGGADGAHPFGSLIQASDGFLYGTTLFGGDPACTVAPYTGCGTIFKIDTSGRLTPLHQFSGGSEGGVPFSGLVQAGDGNFYGTTAAGGNSGCSADLNVWGLQTYQGCGTVFRMDSTGNVNAVYSFTGYPSDGSNPVAPLIQGSDGYLYGTTLYGGSSSSSICLSSTYSPMGCGTAFKLVSPGGPLPSLARPATIKRTSEPPAFSLSSGLDNPTAIDEEVGHTRPE